MILLIASAPRTDQKEAMKLAAALVLLEDKDRIVSLLPLLASNLSRASSQG